MSIHPEKGAWRKKRYLSQVLIVLVTCPSTVVSRRLADELIRRRLAACVNILPGVASVFLWKGRIDRCKEALMIIKTTDRAFQSLQRAIRTLHPYEVPEIIALPLAAGHHPYLKWVRESVSF